MIELSIENKIKSFIKDAIRLKNILYIESRINGRRHGAIKRRYVIN